MTVKRFLISLLLLLLVPTAQAVVPLKLPSPASVQRVDPWSELGSIAGRYRSRALSLLLWLRTTGIDELGCRPTGLRVRVQDLEDLVRKASFLELPAFEKHGAATRWSAFYRKGLGEIFLNRDARSNWETPGALAIHEVLGAAGYPDRNYEAAMLIHLATEFSSPDHESPSMKANRSLALANIKRLLSYSLCEAPPSLGGIGMPAVDAANERLKLARGGGGADIVGGGGDEEALLVKIQLFERYIREGNPDSAVSERVLWAIAHMRVELLGAPNLDQCLDQGLLANEARLVFLVSRDVAREDCRRSVASLGRAWERIYQTFERRAPRFESPLAHDE